MSVRTTRRLALGSSIAALTAGLSLVPHPALAQGFNGTGSVQSGSVSIVDLTPTSTQITIDSERAIVNWTPTDNTGTAPFTFQSLSQSVDYVAGSGLPIGTPFVILNRILPANTTRRADFFGAVNDVSGGNGIWFYSPGGFLLGATANFNVGNMVLSTGDFTDVSGEFFPSSTSFSVTNTVGNQSSIVTDFGSLITATAANSFVVLVAPSVSHLGNINVNGSAALVAAEAVDFTYNAGLFSITATSGTERTGSVLNLGGAITGPASTGSTDLHRIYAVAIPKNDAITMSISAGGQLGFDIAGAADVSGNTIVLSGGHNVVANPTDPISVTPFNATSADVRIRRGTYTSAVDARSNTIAEIADFTAGGTPDINFASDVRITAPNASVFANQGTISFARDVRVRSIADGGTAVGGSASLGAGGVGTQVSVIGNAFVTTDAIGGNSVTAAGLNATGGTSTVSSQGGAIFIDSGLAITATARGGNGLTQGGDAQGGTAQINVDNASGGSLSVTGSITLDSTASGGFNTGTGRGGNATGGTAIIRTGVGTTNSIGADGTVSVQATAQGGIGNGSGFSGGNATGGTAQISAQTGTITFDGLVAVSASASAGGANSDANGGTATGGTAQVSTIATGSSLSIFSGLTVASNATGGEILSGLGTSGAANAGTAQLSAGNGTITVVGATGVVANATGSNGPTHGLAQGGQALVNVNGSGSMDIENIVVDAGGTGGLNNIGFGTAGNGRGGNAQIVATNAGVITITGTANVNAGGLGGVTVASGSGPDGGDGIGGTASISQATNGTIAISGDTNVSADGSGSASYGSGDGIGGTGQGGDARLVVNNSLISVGGNVRVSATGAGGSGGASAPSSFPGSGGAGIGGLANIGSQVGTVDITGTSMVDARGIGGDALFSGSGGAGTGGQALIGITNGGSAQINMDGIVLAQAAGTGGTAIGSGNTSGAATGGAAQLFAVSGTITAGADTTLVATGLSGTASGGASTGAAQGGNSLTRSSGGIVAITGNVIQTSSATSGLVFSGAGNVGTATGGSTIIEVINAAGSIGITGQASISANATGSGGQSGTNGLARGGIAVLRTLSAGSSITIGSNAILTANAQGGFNGTAVGGNALGGNAQVFATLGTIQTGNMNAAANGSGGLGFTGGTGTGGVASAEVTSGTLTINGDGDIEAAGLGGGGSGGNGGNATGGRAGLVSISGGTGSALITGDLDIVATAEAGDAIGLAGNGGVATAGRLALSATDAPVTINGGTFLQSFALGGDGVNGGAALDNVAPEDSILFAQNTTLGLNAVSLDGYAIGGAGRNGGSGGAATAGVFNLVTGDGNTAIPSFINAGAITINSYAQGGAGGAASGAVTAAGGAGGAATSFGGSLFARSANGRVTLGAVTVDNRSLGGIGGAGSSAVTDPAGVGGAGGAATSGVVTLGTFSAAAGATPAGYMRATSASLDSSAIGGAGGQGGTGSTGAAAGGAGGAATGGGATILSRGTEVTIGAVTLSGNATGGAGGNNGSGAISGAGGNATGGAGGVLGSPNFITPTSVASVSLASVTASASATGGNGGVSGGTALGGSAAVALDENGATVTNTGAITITGLTTLNANATGGSASGAGAGTATGGNAELGGLRGTMTLTGAVTTSATGTGGASATATGASGTGGNAFVGLNSALRGGTMIFGSTLSTDASGFGGVGRNGGAGAGGQSRLGIEDGSISVASATTLAARGVGGAALAGLGGQGGSGTGGTATAGFTNPTAPSNLTFTTIVMQAGGTGAAGGSLGAAGAALGLTAGGRGGDGIGGRADFGSLSSAGTISAASAQASTSSIGGAGGAAGTFGAGGVGGNATGGVSTLGFGTTASPLTGSITLATAVTAANGTGGAGGAGTTVGAGGNGNGGDALMGTPAGGALSATTQFVLQANGVGGAGSVAGVGSGGNALMGAGPNPNGGVSSITGGTTNLIANGFSIIGGAPQPTGFYGRTVVSASSAPVTLASLAMNAGGAAGETARPVSFGFLNSGLSVRNTTLRINGPLTGNFAGNTALFTDGGDIIVAAPTNGLTFNSGSNIIESVNGLTGTTPGRVLTPGFIQIAVAGNINTATSFGSLLNTDVRAGGSINAGGFGADGYLYLQSGTTLTAGDIVAGDIFEILAGGDVVFGDIRADSDVDLTGNGNFTAGTVSAGDSVLLGFAGSVTTGDIDAGINTPSTAPDAGYGVGIRGGGAVTTGAINAAGLVGLASVSDAVSTGGIAGEAVALLASTGVDVAGPITTPGGATNVTYIADASMLPLIDPVTLDPAPLFAAIPVALNGPVSVADAIDTGRLAIAATGDVTLGGTVTAQAVPNVFAPGIYIDSGSSVVTSDLLALQADIFVNGRGSISAGNLGSAAGMALTSNGSIAALDANSGNFAEFFTDGGGVTLGAVRAGTTLNITASGDVLASSLSTGGSIRVAGAGSRPSSISVGPVDVGVNSPSTEPGEAYWVAMEAHGPVSLGNVTSVGPQYYLSEVDAVSAGNVQFGSFLLSATRTGASFGSATGAADSVIYVTDTASIPAGFDLFTPFGGSAAAQTAFFNQAAIRTGGPVSFSRPVTTGRLIAASTGDFTASGAITAAQSALINSGGLARFGGLVSSPLITLTSADIDLPDGAALGDAGTTELNITVEPGASTVTLGGGNVAGYSLNQQEAARLRARQIRLSAPANVTLGAMAVQAANLNGNSGSFTIQAPGTIQVTGAVQLQNAAADNTLALVAGQRILVGTTSGGALRVTGATPTALGGRLSLSAPDIWAGDQQLIVGLLGDINFAGRDARLAAVPATPLAEPVISANTLDFRAGRSLFIQNSGTTSENAGFSAGSGGITLTALPSATATTIDVIINGKALSDTGTTLINFETRDAFTFVPGSPARSLSALSSVNGCLFSADSCAIEPDEHIVHAQIQAATEPQEIDEKTEEERKKANRAVAESDKKPSVVMSRLIEGATVNNDDVIDEPVTGAGNPSLWPQPGVEGDQ